MHISKEKFVQYIKGLTEEDESKQIEAHLTTCDFCLEHYLKVVEQNVEIEMNDCPDLLITSVLQEVNGVSQSFEKAYRKQEKKQTMKHYLVAASITLLLLTGGLFESVVSTFSMVEQKVNQNEPFSLEVIEEVRNVLESLRGGKENE